MAPHSANVEPSSPWLAINFGCCASRDSYESDDVRPALPHDNGTEMQICYSQPQSVPLPRAEPEHPRPTTSHSMGRHVSQWVANSRDFASKASARTSIATLHRPWTSHSKARPSISRPTDFRRYDGVDGVESMMEENSMPVRRRRSFRPLELSIYLADGRLSPLPDFSDSEWDKLPAQLGLPALAHVRDHDSRTNSISSNPSTSSYLIQRRPIGSGSRRSSVQSTHSTTLPPGSYYPEENLMSRPESLARDSIRRSSTHSGLISPYRSLSRLSSPSRARSNTEGGHILSSSARGSLRKPRTDVDEAIRELNTIVEERRADAYRSNNQSPAFIRRPPPSPSHHVPLIAPSLRMHVRSETLSDIGSAFSVPLAPKPLPTPPPAMSRRGTKLTLTPPSRAFTGGPLSSNPITPPTPTAPSPTTAIGRLGAWLKRSLPSTPTTPSFLKSQTPPQEPSSPAIPFYQCNPQAPSSHTASRPSTAGSRTMIHMRQDSNETATVTLISYPSTPSLTSRAPSPEHHNPPTPGTIQLERFGADGTVKAPKTRKIPLPLNLDKEKEIMIEAPLSSAGTLLAQRSIPPRSPAWDLLKGMEIPVSPGRAPMDLSPVSPVGVAF